MSLFKRPQRSSSTFWTFAIFPDHFLFVSRGGQGLGLDPTRMAMGSSGHRIRTFLRWEGSPWRRRDNENFLTLSSECAEGHTVHCPGNVWGYHPKDHMGSRWSFIPENRLFQQEWVAFFMPPFLIFPPIGLKWLEGGREGGKEDNRQMDRWVGKIDR